MSESVAIKISNFFIGPLFVLAVFLGVLFLIFSVFPGLRSYVPLAEDSAPIFLTKFSSRQSVKAFSDFGEDNSIHLNNGGTLTPNIIEAKMINSKPFIEGSVGLVLNMGLVSTSKDKWGPGSSFFYNQTDVYLFDTVDNRQKEIKVGQKTFLVTLESISSIGSSERSNYEYTFGVLEE
jgi:hypothetical protein